MCRDLRHQRRPAADDSARRSSARICISASTRSSCDCRRWRRRSDIPDLARHLLARTAQRPIEQVSDLLTPETVDTLLEHHWKGNVRELANVMEYAYILSGGQHILPEHLPQNICQGSGPATIPLKPNWQSAPVARPMAAPVAAAPSVPLSTPTALSRIWRPDAEEIEMEQIFAC